MLAVPLGACSSFPGHHLFAHGTDEARSMRSLQTSSVDYSPVIDRDTQSGRALLANGQPGSAIESFERALSAGEPVAPAINGLGIAYARLGRLDLAKRFFERAIAVDPGNDRYQDNLTLLLASPQYALEQHANCSAQPMPAGQADAQSSTFAERDGRAATAAGATPGKLVRISRNEVFLATAPALRAPIMASATVLGSRANAGKRMALNAGDLQHFVSVVHIVLPTAEPGTAHFSGSKPQLSAGSNLSRTVVFPATTGKRLALYGAEVRHFVPVVQFSLAGAGSAFQHAVGARFQSLALVGQ
jgi:hypothetical protein